MIPILGPDGPFTNLPPSIEAQVDWTATCEEMAVMFSMAGIGAYRQKLGEVADAGCEGFRMTRESETAGV